MSNVYRFSREWATERAARGCALVGSKRKLDGVPCCCDAFILELGLVERLVKLSVPSIGDRVPVGVAVEEVVGGFTVVLADREASDWREEFAGDDVATVPSWSVAMID